MSLRPLDGFVVLDFSQFLAGPLCTTRLGDLGARVIKVERPDGGEIGRQLAFAGVVRDGDTLSFHIANRNKESFAADLKDPDDAALVYDLIRRADVLVSNFRPGVMERLGFDYPSVTRINPRLIYATITGYGAEGPWRTRPGQDLLAQSLSGLPWLSGNAGQTPVPVGIAVADIVTSIHLATGITAALLRRERSGIGALVETSLLEAMLDLQFELLSAKADDATLTIDRATRFAAHPFLQAPYGVYPTQDGYLALAMNPLDTLAELIQIDAEELAEVDGQSIGDEAIRDLIAERLRLHPTEFWLALLDNADIWCAPVLTHDELFQHEGFRALNMMQTVARTAIADAKPVVISTTRSPVRFDGEVLTNHRGAPHLGEHTEAIKKELSQ